MLRACLALVLCFLAACRTGGPDTSVWVVASDLDNRPFAWVDEAGQPRGRDVEMMQLLAFEEGARLEWRRMAFEELLPACERGQVDVVCATLGITDERARRVRFTRPYFATEIVLVVRERPGRPRTLNDLAGLRVAGAPGTTSESAVRERLPRSVGVFEGSKEAGPTLERLLAGQIDAAAMDGPAARALVAASAGRLALLETPLASENYGLALPRHNVALAEKLDAALEELAPELRALDARHGLAR